MVKYELIFHNQTFYIVILWISHKYAVMYPPTHKALLPGVIQGYQTIAGMFQVFLPFNSHPKKQKCLLKFYDSITKWLPLPEQQSRYIIKLQKTFFWWH